MIPGLFKGGVPKMVYELSKAQIYIGNSVDIYTTDYNSDEKVIVSEKISDNGITIFYFKAEKKFGSISSAELLKYLEKNIFNYDIVHFHNTFHILNYLGIKICLRNKMKFFIHPHGALDPNLIDENPFIQRVKKKIYIKYFESKNLDNANCVFCLSENEKIQIAKWCTTQKIIIVPNGINFATKPKRIKPLPNTGSLIYGYLGRIEPKRVCI